MKYTNETFEGRDIVLDGNEYDACVFDRCRLIYEGGTLPSFKGAGTFQHSAFVFEGAAMRTMQYMKLLRAIGAGHIVDQAFATLTASPPANE